MFEDIIEYEELQEASHELFGFSGVTFLRDFGPFKKGEILPKDNSLWFTLDGAPVCREQDKEGILVRSCKFQLTAIE